ncbi:MAG: shikimate kinase [Deltaproteobacteria bacterium]|nr:shikimate kinase [Deltaproteobacteria bacterium]
MTRTPHRRELLLLWGFMGAGKTSVGRALAEVAGVPFIDLDESIASELSMPVSRVLATHGEQAFRSIERAAVRQILTSRGPRVVALGGGSLLDPHLRAAAIDRAFVVVLLASVETLVARTRGTDRPLLRDAPEVEVPRLLGTRAAAYSEAHHTVRTDARTALQVAEDLARIWLGAR